MKLSIVIPAKNEEKYLPLLLDSIKKQSFKDYEVIVADNNSKDKTKEISKSYGCKIVKGGLPSKGRNAGAKIAKGEIILFLDADVVLPNNFLANTLKEFEKEEAGVAICGFKPIGDKRKIGKIDAIIYQVGSGIVRLANNFTFLSLGAGWCIFVKKEIHNLINGFDEDLVMAEDHDYIRRSRNFGKFSILKNSTVFVSNRRIEKAGTINVLLECLLCEIHIIFFGPIKKDIFHHFK